MHCIPHIAVHAVTLLALSANLPAGLDASGWERRRVPDVARVAALRAARSRARWGPLGMQSIGSEPWQRAVGELWADLHLGVHAGARIWCSQQRRWLQARQPMASLQDYGIACALVCLRLTPPPRPPRPARQGGPSPGRRRCRAQQPNQHRRGGPTQPTATQQAIAQATGWSRPRGTARMGRPALDRQGAHAVRLRLRCKHPSQQHRGGQRARVAGRVRRNFQNAPRRLPTLRVPGRRPHLAPFGLQSERRGTEWSRLEINTPRSPSS
jgi:hypothetical protein